MHFFLHCFTSCEFKEFLKRHGVNHITSGPFHPASNGLAERAVQVVKKGLRKVTKGSMRMRIAIILFHYRLTTIGSSVHLRTVSILSARALLGVLLFSPRLETPCVILYNRAHDVLPRLYEIIMILTCTLY